MNAASEPKTQVLIEPQVRLKIGQLPATMASLLKGGTLTVPETPGRDVQIWPIKDLPPKKGLSTVEGQARLIHDLASIELQAMELGVRTLAEFPDAPAKFRQDLAEVTAEESVHLGLCLDALEELGMPWGSFPTHVGLWISVDASDSLLDRIAIVHRYLEGSGLDATEKILRRLSGVQAGVAERAVRIIRRDEMKHVLFGSHWYHELVAKVGVDPEVDFAARLSRLFHRIPRRLEPIVGDVRREAGFLPGEIRALEELRERWLTTTEPVHREVSQKTCRTL